jgi:uncharacterized NAD-dependent epimerase/dehydratase family protein
MELNLRCARLTNPDVQVLGLAFNTSALADAEAQDLMARTAETFGLPCVDPVRTGVAPLVERLTAKG